MAKDPAFLFYSKDWLEGTAELTPAEKGVYIDLLAYQHQRGDLPNEPRRLARLAGLAIAEFEPIWEVLKEKFVANGNRLVNRKLTEVMTERSAKAHRNRIVGIFAALIRHAKITNSERATLKKMFEVEQFVGIPAESLTKSLTEWFTKRLASLGNGNGTANGNGNEDSKEDRGVGEETIDFTQPDVPGDTITFPLDTRPMRQLWAAWKKYRWDVHGLRYRLYGEQADLSRLQGMTYQQIEETIKQAIAGNWKNLYPEHGKSTTSTGTGKSKQERNAASLVAGFAARYGEDAPG